MTRRHTGRQDVIYLQYISFRTFIYKFRRGYILIFLLEYGSSVELQLSKHGWPQSGIGT
jgi:hypothetical protein